MKWNTMFYADLDEKVVIEENY